MAKVTLRHLEKRFGKVTVIRDFDLEIRDREFMVLVGPSGCGKSTVLRMIAGLEELSGGEILIDDIVVNDKPPKDRDIAMVFQSYALYPHMTVRENLEFGLKIRKTSQAEIDLRVGEAADILGIKELLDRRPRDMSGGQRQRVAVGRAIVRKPRVFLFDEPLSNLDAKLRVQMRAEISKLQRRLETTTVYVTHDQVEAMTMGHRIAIMKDGDLQQCGTPLEVYEQPANLFVAAFIGTPPMNFIRARFTEGGRMVDAGYLQLPVRAELHQRTQAMDGQEVLVGIRPENLIETARGKGGDTVPLEVEVEVIMPLGHEVLVHGRAGSDLLVAKVDPHRSPPIGGLVQLEIELDAVHLFDIQTERRITKEPS